MKRSVILILALLGFSVATGAQGNGIVTVSVTNVSANITVDRDCNYVVIRENSANPTAVFSITIAGASTAINLAAGAQFQFTAQRGKGNGADTPFKSGSTIGTIVATTSGPFSFIAIETFGDPHVIAKNTGASGVTSFDTRTGAVTLQASDLPSPTASTLGGTESFAAVTNEFLDSISTAGVPHASQPSCSSLSNAAASCSSDATNASNILSGTLGAGRLPWTLSGTGTVIASAASSLHGAAANTLTCADGSGNVTVTACVLPNPSASTLGGVESLAAVSHNFLTSISTSGVPAQAQPACGDLSDATLCNAASSGSGNVARVTSPTLVTPALGTPSAINLSNATSLPCGAMPALTGAVTSSSGSCATSAAASSGTTVYAGPSIGSGSSNAGWNNYTFVSRIGGNGLVAFPTSWKITFFYVGGTGVSLNKVQIKRTLTGSLSIIDSTTVTFSTSNSYDAAFGATATVSAPQFVTSDAISLTLDHNHDYYIYQYYNSDGTYNGTLGILQNGLCGTLVSTDTSADHTGDSTVFGQGTCGFETVWSVNAS